MADGPDHDALPSDEHLRLAGFALAHALGSIDGDGTLYTHAVVNREGSIQLVRYDADSIPESIVAARRDLPTRLGPSGLAALVYDGYVTIDRDRRDALIVDLIAAGGKIVGSLQQRYRPGRFGLAMFLRHMGVPVPGGLQVIGPPITDSTLRPGASEALTRGLAEHPYGRRVYRLSDRG
jgi:hypothetical protein